MRARAQGLAKEERHVYIGVQSREARETPPKKHKIIQGQHKTWVPTRNPLSKESSVLRQLRGEPLSWVKARDIEPPKPAKKAP